MPKNDKEDKTPEVTIIFVYQDALSGESPFTFSFSSNIEGNSRYGFDSLRKMAEGLFRKIVCGLVKTPAILLNRVPDSTLVKIKKQGGNIDRYSPIHDDCFSALQNFFKVS